MNAEDLIGKLNYATASGHCLSVEQRAAIQSSLLLLKKNSKFSRIVFWGKIFGINRDYLIAQGCEKSNFGPKKSFCSHDGVDWVQLPDVDEETGALCDKIEGRFTGDPSQESIVEIPNDSSESAKPQQTTNSSEEDYEDEYEDDEEETQAPATNNKAPSKMKKIIITEEKRLARTIQLIDRDCSVVPRGAFMQTAEHHVVENTSFTGLSVSECDRLENFFHLRDPQKLYKKSLLAREGLVNVVDFMDSISEDVPKGCWSLNRDSVTNWVSLRSLVWPGFFAYHVANTANHGYVYFGFGEKNWDIPFML